MMQTDKKKELYFKLLDQANELADFVDGKDPYEDRIKKLPELNALVERLRECERIIWPEKDISKYDLRKFLECFPGCKTFQTFDDDSVRKDKSLISMRHISGKFSVADFKYLKNFNDRGAGIFLTINETDGAGRGIKNIIKINAAFGDFDGCLLYPVWEYMPSMVIESSSGKFHAYWWVDDDKFPVEGFRQIQEAISEKFGSDPKVKDPSRVMRVPGFYHKKATPYMTRIIYYNHDRKYTFAELTEKFPPKPAKQWSSDKWQKKELCKDFEFNGQYGAVEGGRNCHITRRIGGMLKRGMAWSDIEHEAHREGSACNPPLSEKEVSLILKSCQRYC